MIIYDDGFKVGNVLRPDKGRGLDAVYWSLKEFPDWLRCSEVGWFPLVYVDEKDLQKHKVHKSWPLEFACQTVFGHSNAPNLASMGVLCNCSCGEKVHVQIHNNVLLLDDEVALVGQLSLKGCNGKKPCIKCKNVMARTELEELAGDPYLRHFKAGMPEDFDLHTDNSVFQMVGVLKTAKARGVSNDKFQELEKAFGLTYGGFMFSDMIRRHVRPATGTMYDWLHCFLSSGGVAQYHLHQFVLDCKDDGGRHI